VRPESAATVVADADAAAEPEAGCTECGTPGVDGEGDVVGPQAVSPKAIGMTQIGDLIDRLWDRPIHPSSDEFIAGTGCRTLDGSRLSVPAGADGRLRR
jgi:hypothetical protein